MSIRSLHLRAATASKDHPDHPVHPVTMVSMVRMGTMARMEEMAKMEASCVLLFPTSRALSAPLVCPEIRVLQDRRAPEDQRELQERTERMATRERVDCRDLSACKDHKAHQDLQDQREHQDESSKSTDQPDLRARQDLQALKAKRDNQAPTEPTLVAHPVLKETTAQQDLLVHLALRDHQDLQAKQESRAAASTAHLLVPHLDIKRLLAILVHLRFSPRERR